ncbi:MAG: dTDP-4-dehydrorhamnose reductase, partial [Hyphococcus sp.]
MRILLFGRTGQVARCFQEEAAGHDVTALGRDACDLLQDGAAARAIGELAPDAVVNAAAYTAVDKAEEEGEQASRINAGAVGEMAQAAHALGAPFIHLSTDYVFDGAQSTPYREDDPTAPINAYGETKRAGEAAALSAHDGAIIMRTSWIFSEYGANFMKTMLRLASERTALTIVNDQIGGPTPARNIARAVLGIAEKKHRGAGGRGVYHYQGQPAVSWADFAVKIFEIAGADMTVTPIATRDYPTPAKRPLHTVLDCARI